MLSYVLLDFAIDCFNCLIFIYDKFFLNCDGLPDGKVVTISKNENGSLV